MDWSPDGQTLLFNAHSGGEAACVWAIDVDGRNPRKLTGDEGHDFGQAWSADGREILFHQSDRIPGFYTMGPNGRNRTELLVPFKAGIARWSPSEEEIIFVMDGDIHIGSIAEQNVRRLVELPGRERSPDWFDPAHARAVSAESRTPVIWGQLKGSEARPAE